MFKMTFKLDEERMERDGLDVEDAWKQIDEMLVKTGDIHMDEKGVVIADNFGSHLFFERMLKQCTWFMKYVSIWTAKVSKMNVNYISELNEMGIRCCYE